MIVNGELEGPQISSTKETQSEELEIFTVEQKPVMIEVVNVLTHLGRTKKAILRAKGDAIPNAVAVANIITEKMLKGNSKVQNIILDTVSEAGIGDMTSTIEIILNKI